MGKRRGKRKETKRNKEDEEKREYYFLHRLKSTQSRLPLPRFPYTNLKKSRTEKKTRLLSMRSRDSLQGK